MIQHTALFPCEVEIRARMKQEPMPGSSGRSPGPEVRTGERGILSVRQTRKDSAGEEEEGEVEVVLEKVVVRIGGSIRRRTTQECTSSATTTACLLLS